MDLLTVINRKELGIRESWGYSFSEKTHEVISHLRRDKFLNFSSSFLYVNRSHYAIVLVCKFNKHDFI